MNKLQRATSCDIILNFSSAPVTATLAYSNGYIYYNFNWITIIFIQSVHNMLRFLMIMLIKLSVLELKFYRCCLRIYRTPLVYLQKTIIVIFLASWDKDVQRANVIAWIKSLTLTVT